jgi:hypothetical protein
MKHDSSSERLSEPLALCCAIAVFLAAACDVEIERSPAVATIVQVVA